MTKLFPLAVIVLLPFQPVAVAQTVDADAAQTLARKGQCFRCHAIDKRKKAPAYKEIAQKYRGKPDAENKLLLHITGQSTVKVEDADEKHEAPPTKDPAELTNIIRWILIQ